MTEATSAGALLRAAREKQGLHIAALAAAIKVAPRKLDALEHDRYEELPDATFTRALAQTVCRSLKVDPAPVLALLPLADPAPLDHVAGTLNTPFRDRPGRDDGAGLAVAAIRPMAWAGVGLLVAAAIVYFLPAGIATWPASWGHDAAPAAASAPSGADTVAEAASATVATAASAAPVQAIANDAAASQPDPVPLPGPAATSPAAAPAEPSAVPAAEAPPPPGLIQLRTSGESWVEARDGRGHVVFSRLVGAGESIGFDGALPVRLTIGNAPVTRVTFRGRPVDLGPTTRDNVARLELQ